MVSWEAVISKQNKKQQIAKKYNKNSKTVKKILNKPLKCIWKNKMQKMWIWK